MPPLHVVSCDAFRRLFLEQVSFLDVRAPIEFARAQLPRSMNVPILSDEERKQVGTTYRKNGRTQALELGYSLVSGSRKSIRIEAWRAAIQDHPNCYLICARGGLRSQIAQEWLHQHGINIPRIEGGYKALRHYLLSCIDQQPEPLPIVLLAGPTGSGKTQLLRTLQHPEYHVIDLEALANHRGSAFGALGLQPGQATFENTLAAQLLRIDTCSIKAVLMENESRSIGRNWLPPSLFRKMSASPVIELSSSMEERVECIFQEYILSAIPFLEATANDSTTRQIGLSKLGSQLDTSLEKIQRRLGAELYQRLKGLLHEGIVECIESGETEKLRQWIAELLTNYYDPMYLWHSQKTKRTVLFRGNKQAVLEYLNAKFTTPPTPQTH